MDLPLVDESVPHLSQVVPSLLAALGFGETPGDLGLPECSRACVLLVDGLGWELLEDHAADAPVLAELTRSPLRVGYPATTAAALTALGTGVPAGEHGLVGYTFDLPGVGVIHTLGWRLHFAGADLRTAHPPEEVQPLETTFARAAAAGVNTSVVSAAQFAGSGLTRAALRGGNYVGVHALGDLAASVLAALEPTPSLCYAYHSELDLVGHLRGPGSPAWRMQLRQVDRLVESIVDGLSPGSLLAVVADHGMVAIDDTAIDIDATPQLLDGVREIAGEARARHVYVTEGALPDVVSVWREVLGERAWVVERDQAIAEGWFGPRVTDRVRPRLGDVVVAARGNTGLLRREAETLESSLIGQHGSLTTAEQLVPLATYVV